MTAPALTQYVNGINVVSDDQLNTFCQTTNLTTDLRSLTGLSGMQVSVRGLAAANDGGAGNFYWSPNSTAADDGVSVICPNGVTLGRWLRLLPLGSVYVNYATPISNVLIAGSEAIPTWAGMFDQGTTQYEVGAETMAAIGMYVTKGATETGTNLSNKVALAVGVRLQAGGGDTWGQNTLVQADATAPNVNIYGEELDCNNLSPYPRDGLTWAPMIGHQVSMNGAARGAVAYSVIGNSTAGFGWSVGFSVGQATAVQDSAFRDSSNATYSLDIRGTKALGIDARLCILTGASWMISPGGGALSWYVGGNIYRGINMTVAGVLQLGQDCPMIDLVGTRTMFSTVPDDHADDTAAAAGGIVVGGIYRTASALKVRVT